MITLLVDGFHSNLVASTDPETEPTAMQLPKIPKSNAFLSNTLVAIVALNSSGNAAKVPKQKTTNSNAFRSGLALMYSNASFI